MASAIIKGSETGYCTSPTVGKLHGAIKRRERLGGILSYYTRSYLAASGSISGHYANAGRSDTEIVAKAIVEREAQSRFDCSSGGTRTAERAPTRAGVVLLSK